MRSWRTSRRSRTRSSRSARKLVGRSSSANQIDHLATKLRRVGGWILGSEGTSGESFRVYKKAGQYHPVNHRASRHSVSVPKQESSRFEPANPFAPGGITLTTTFGSLEESVDAYTYTAGIKKRPAD